MQVESIVNLPKFIVDTPDLTLELLQINSLDFLADKKLVEKAATLYREIYGSEEIRDGKVIWGEGARDPANPKHKISLDEYKLRLAADDLIAPSGQLYELCFPDEHMLGKFKHELTNNAEQETYFACLRASSALYPDPELVGLSWGGLTSLKLIKESLVQDLVTDTPELLPEQIDEVLALLHNLNGTHDKMLFIRELIIREDYRKAGQYATYLVQLALEHGEHFGNANLFFWTSANSLMTSIALAGGLTKIYEAGNYQFFYGDDPTMRQLAQDYRASKNPVLFFKQRILNYLRTQRKISIASTI